MVRSEGRSAVMFGEKFVEMFGTEERSGSLLRRTKERFAGYGVYLTTTKFQLELLKPGNMMDNVISIDSDSDEDGANILPSISAASSHESLEEAANIHKNATFPQEPKLTSVGTPDNNTIFLDDDSESAVENIDPFDYEEAKQVLDSYIQRPSNNSKHGRNRNQTCSNSWCSNLAVKEGHDFVLDYYDIPKGKYSFCQNCIDAFPQYIDRCLENLKNGTSILDGQCPHLNDFIDLDDLDSDGCKEVAGKEEDASSSDVEMEELLAKAFNSVLDEVEDEFDVENALTKTYEDLEKTFLNSCNVSEECIEKLRCIEREWYFSIEKFKSEFKKKSVYIGELDLPPFVIDPHSNSLVVDGSQQNNGIEDTNNEPEDLPPYGFIVRPCPAVGEKCYAMVNTEFSEWVPFSVVNITHEIDHLSHFMEVFHLKAESSRSDINQKKVGCDGIAYSAAHQVRLNVGLRIIAAFNHNRGDARTKSFYSGAIAELPTHLNNYRYLIFFDDGRVQYCPHRDVRLVYKSKKKVHEYFFGNLSQFMLNYLANFPHRCLLKTEVGHYVSIERDSYWVNARVDSVDGSIMRVTYLNDEKHEWIFRGSPRLLPIYERIKGQQAKLKTVVKTSATATAQVGTTVSHSHAKEVLIAGEIIISDSSTSSDEESRYEMEPSSSVAVARKTTSRVVQSFQYSPTYQPAPKRVTRTSSIIRRYPDVLYPRAYLPHKCSKACVTWVRYSEEKMAGVSLLAVPSTFAFRREIDLTTEVKYISPCGKRLSCLKDVLKYLSDTSMSLTLDMFDFDTRSNIYDEFVVESRYIIMQDISFGGEKSPIPCINDVNNDCPDLMTYMTERRALDGVHINTDPGFLICCDCEDNCRDKMKCQCWKHTVDSYRPFNVGDDRRDLKKVGYEYQRLYQNVLSGVYECNSQCKCNQVTCINRVVQHGMRHKLQLFKTAKKGWGTRTVIDIPQGVFICTYVGNIMPETYANETGKVHGDEYFAELDHIEVMQQYKADFEEEAPSISDEDEDEILTEEDQTGQSMQHYSQSSRARRSCTLRKNKRYSENSPAKKRLDGCQNNARQTSTLHNQDDESDEDADTVRKFYGPNESVYVMDAKIAGNIGRYFNHSCDPNMFVQNVYIDTHDLRFPWVAFFALKHIPAGSELTWDYGYSIGSVPGKILYCYCNARNCRRRLL